MLLRLLTGVCVTVLLALSLLLGSEAPSKPQQGISQKDIDLAVARGVEWLKKAPEPTAEGGYKNADELILLAVLNGGLSEKDDFFQQLLSRTLNSPLDKTYKVSIQAMLLEELERVKHQVRIAECAQFLIDNMCVNGQWSYGSPTKAVLDLKDIPSIAERPEPDKKKVGKFFFMEREKPKVVRRIPVKKSKDGPAAGDNSNAQYASLGMRACHDAGILLPADVVQKARQWWTESQHPSDDGADPKAVASGAIRPRGWNYKTPADGKPSHSMTAGAVGAVVIYDYILGNDWKKDAVAQAGAEWLGKHFAVNTSYYYMYGLERAGMLYDVTSFGKHDWYIEGARVLLGAQNDDGSWGKRDGDKPSDVWGTCWAILFLKKATRPVATGDSKK